MHEKSMEEKQKVWKEVFDTALKKYFFIKCVLFSTHRERKLKETQQTSILI